MNSQPEQSFLQLQPGAIDDYVAEASGAAAVDPAYRVGVAENLRGLLRHARVVAEAVGAETEKNSPPTVFAP